MTDIRTVPLLDVPRGNAPLRDEIIAAITVVVDSGRFLFGPDVQKLEAECARWSDTKHGIGCASGSDALLLSLMALDIKPGDESAACSARGGAGSCRRTERSLFRRGALLCTPGTVF